ncbi:hypothetical protein B5H00_16515, partial [Listeria monocytogenes]|nr:hypothetical protein [Listeria monocytogenes]
FFHFFGCFLKNIGFYGEKQQELVCAVLFSPSFRNRIVVGSWFLSYDDTSKSWKKKREEQRK